MQYCTLAIETHFLVRKSTSSMHMQRHFEPKAIFMRHLPYHAAILLYGLSIVIWMLSTKKYAFLGRQNRMIIYILISTLHTSYVYTLSLPYKRIEYICLLGYLMVLLSSHFFIFHV